MLNLQGNSTGDDTIRIGPLRAGIISSSILLIFYLGITTLAGSVNHTTWQIREYWYLLIPLIGGFGVQMSLFTILRQEAKTQRSVAVSGGISAGSMIACCTHHVTDIVPFLGFTALTLSLTRYIPLFFLLGILSNFIGTIIMLENFQRAGIYRSGMLSWILKYDMRSLKYSALIISGVLFMIALLFYSPSIPPEEILK